MENLVISLNAVLPLLLSMGVGYFVRLRKWVDDAFVTKCNAFAFKVFMGFLLFSNLYTADLSSFSAVKMILFAVVAETLVFVISFFGIRRFFLDEGTRAVLTQAIFRETMLFLAFPLPPASTVKETWERRRCWQLSAFLYLMYLPSWSWNTTPRIKKA